MSNTHKDKKLNIILASALLVIAVLLAVVKWWLPSYVLDTVNLAIAEAEGISGHVERADVEIFSGRYSFYQVSIDAKNENEDLPLLRIERVSYSLAFAALVDGQLATRLSLVNPQLYVFDREEEKLVDESVKDEDTWITLANKLSPVPIDHVSVSGGNFFFKPTIENKNTVLAITGVKGFMLNVSSPSDATTLSASFSLHGNVMGVAKANIQGKFDPHNPAPTFDVDFSMEPLRVDYVDSLIKFYTPFDIEGGTIDASMELLSKNGNLDGYVKAGVYDVNVFNWHKDVVHDGDSVFSWLFETVTDGIANIFQRGQSHLIATKIPIRGTIERLDISTGDAIANTFKHAFSKPFDMRDNDLLSFENLSPDSDENKSSKQNNPQH